MMNVDKLRTALATRLQEVSSVEVLDRDWLTIETTSTLRDRFFEAIASQDVTEAKVFASRKGYGIVSCVMSWLSSRFGDREGVLLHCHDRVTGALRIRLRDAMSSFPQLWELVREDFCVFTEDMSFGLMLELNHFDANRKSTPRGTFELSVWGAELPSEDSDMRGCDIDKLGSIPDLGEIQGGTTT